MLSPGSLKEPVTGRTVEMIFEAVHPQQIVSIKMRVALATKVVFGTLDIVLSERTPRIIVFVTRLTPVVSGRVVQVLTIGLSTAESAVARIAVAHGNEQG